MKIYCITVFLMVCAAHADTFRDVYADTWVAVDALRRELPVYDQVGPPRANRTVGIFYFLWLGQHHPTGPYDITEILKKNPQNTDWGPPGAFHHWGKSELGYYRSESVYAVRRHARMLSDAGIDTLIFDVTNAFTYDAIYLALCEEFTKFRAAGQLTPQIMFLTHTRAETTIQTLYDNLYSKFLYKDLWFMWKGKPLILGNPENLDPKLCDFFTIRDCWAWTYGKDTWQWLDHWPQKYAWHESEDKPEEVSVCVAEHPVSNIGRSHFNGKQPECNHYGVGPQTHKGLYFKQQWQRALEIDPEFIFITGWNEWVAQRFIKEEGKPPGEMIARSLRPGDTFFVDAYTQEYSRDIEPMDGGYTDNYYYQMIGGIRRYKGVRKPQSASALKTIVIDGYDDDWRDVRPEFRDHIGDVEHRNENGWADTERYINTTGRNDFVNMKVARDDQNIYFYVQTDNPITSHTDKNWMLLFIDADQNHNTGWEGYDYVVNLSVQNENTTSLHALSSNEWSPEPIEEIQYAVHDKIFELSIPRSVLNLSENKVAFDFHWADNIQKYGDIIEFSLNGDSAPQRRFNYRYFTE